MNQRRGEGNVVSFEVVPFVNGNDPTQPPVSRGFGPIYRRSQLTCNQKNLPPLHSVNAIENLNGHDLVQYLTGYGAVPPVGPNPHATNRLRKETLTGLIGALT